MREDEGRRGWGSFRTTNWRDKTLPPKAKLGSTNRTAFEEPIRFIVKPSDQGLRAEKEMKMRLHVQHQWAVTYPVGRSTKVQKIKARVVQEQMKCAVWSWNAPNWSCFCGESFNEFVNLNDSLTINKDAMLKCSIAFDEECLRKYVFSRYLVQLFSIDVIQGFQIWLYHGCSEFKCGLDEMGLEEGENDHFKG